jgi:hypothetical protein
MGLLSKLPPQFRAHTAFNNPWPEMHGRTPSRLTTDVASGPRNPRPNHMSTLYGKYAILVAFWPVKFQMC